MLLFRLLTKHRSFQRMSIHSVPKTSVSHFLLVRARTTSSSLILWKGGSLRQYVASFAAFDLKDSVKRVWLLKSNISPSRYVVIEEVLVTGGGVPSVVPRIECECGCEGTLYASIVAESDMDSQSTSCIITFTGHLSSCADCASFMCGLRFGEASFGFHIHGRIGGGSPGCLAGPASEEDPSRMRN